MSTPVLLADPANREEWLAQRRIGIGASEIAAVLGISPWESPFGLHWRKVHGWDFEPTDEMRAGLLLEPAIAQWWAQECDPNENLVVQLGALYASADRAWQLATPDRLICLPCPECDGGGTYTSPGGRLVLACPDCDGNGGPPLAVLELKYCAHTWDGWGEPGTDDIPVHYRAQVLWQCDVMGVDEWFLAALGPGGFRWYRGRIDTADVRTMRAAGAAFMGRLEAGEAPPLDGHAATLTALKRLHPTVADVDVQVPLELAEGYRRARALRTRVEASVDRYEARIRAAIGDGRRAMYGKQLVASRSVYEQTGDTAELDALDDDWPVVNRLNPGRAKSYLPERN